jgi:hypothetical protein
LRRTSVRNDWLSVRKEDSMGARRSSVISEMEDRREGAPT